MIFIAQITQFNHFSKVILSFGLRGLTNVFVYTDTCTTSEPDLYASAPETLKFPLLSRRTELCFPLIRQYFDEKSNNGNHLICRGLLLRFK